MITLANKIRPTTLDQFVGQTHIIGKDTALYNLIKQAKIPNMFFYGTPGTGKTTLCKIIAQESGFDFYYFNATSLKIDDLRTIFKQYDKSLIKALIFIDEIHRLSKTQQEVLLPVMEDNKCIIVGASTQNPFYTLTPAIRSRSFVYEFKPLNKNELKELLHRAFECLNIVLDEQCVNYLISSSNGDGRAMLNLLDFASTAKQNITIDILTQLKQQNTRLGGNDKQNHYDTISAFIKSIRGSDVDASLYYLGQLIVDNEEPMFIARRLLISASEDIGNANPNALNIASSTMQSIKEIGYPEAKIILAQCTVYLASSPKSNSSYKAINKAMKMINDGLNLTIPKHITQEAVNYQNPHDGQTKQKYLPKELNIYHSNGIGFEQTLNNWVEKLKD